MRDRLIELLKKEQEAHCKYTREKIQEMLQGNLRECLRTGFEFSADYLLENGVIVPPCKVGDKVFRISTKQATKMKYIQETTISRIAVDNDGTWLFCKCNPIARCVFGKTVFPAEEEAKQALKGGSEK